MTPPDLQPPHRPLDGIRIADFSWAGTGPFGTQLLAFLGAEVIKIETRQRPDSIRRFSRIHGFRDQIDDLDAGAYFNDLSLNKMSLGLNLKDPRGADIARRLIAASDVVVENYKPGTFTRLGFGYDALRALKPDIILCSLTGRGASQGSFPAYAPIFAAMGGLAHLSGYPDGPAGSMRFPIDMMCGAFAAIGILAALWHRAQTGNGQYIDLSCQEVTTCLVGDMVLRAAMGLGDETRRGNAHPRWFPHDCYPCRGEDEWISIAIRSDDEWKALCTVIGRPGLAEAPDTRDAEGRRRNSGPIDAAIRAWTSARSKSDAMFALQAADIPAVPSFNFKDLAEDPHLRARGFFQPVEHPLVGAVTAAGAPWRFLRHPLGPVRPGPLLGQHNRYVLRDLLGYDAEAIAGFEAAAVIEAPTPRPGREELFAMRPSAATGGGVARPAARTTRTGPPGGALASVTVLEAASSASAAYCGRILADLGAKVVKLDTPEGVDEAAYAYENAGKLGAVLDTSTQQGQTLLERLLALADLVIVDEQPGDGGCRWANVTRLARADASKVVVSVTPFGLEGPYAAFRSAPLNSFHAGGQGYLFPPTLDYLDRPPLKTSGNVGEYESGAGACVAALAALFARRVSGRGEVVDFSKQEWGISMNRLFYTRYIVDGVVETRGTQAYPWGGVFACRDGELTLLCQEEHQWQSLVRALDQPSLGTNPRFSSPQMRRANGPELRAVIAAWMAKRTRAEALAVLDREGTPAGPVRRPSEVLDALEFRARGFLQALPTAQAPAAKAPGLPFRMSATPSVIAGPPPERGRQVADVLADLRRCRRT